MNKTKFLLALIGLIDGSKDHKKKQPNATLLSQSDLTIRGPGKLIVNGRRGNGIESHAKLKIESGEIEVNAIKDALKSKDAITIHSGTFNINSNDDGIHSDGTLIINNGTFNISSGDDATEKMKAPNASNNSQYAFLAELDEIPAGTLINVSSDSGTEVLTIKTLGSTRSLLVCSPLLGKGTYKISAGEKVVKTFAISDVITNL